MTEPNPGDRKPAVSPRLTAAMWATWKAMILLMLALFALAAGAALARLPV
ncbi:MAG TPA: hypothetical protein VIG90_18670 [Pedomonas sp.]